MDYISVTALFPHIDFINESAHVIDEGLTLSVQITEGLYEICMEKIRANDSPFDPIVFEVRPDDCRLPSTPMMDHYRVRFTLVSDIHSSYSANIISNTFLRDGKVQGDYECTIHYNDTTLMQILYMFVTHELTHSYIDYKRLHNGSSEDYQKRLRNEYSAIANMRVYEGECQNEVRMIADMLYFSHDFERGAYINQSIGDIRYTKKNRPSFNTLSDRTKLDYLFVSHKYEQFINEYIPYISGLDDKAKENILSIVNSILGSKYSDFDKMIDVLRKKVSFAYSDFRKRVSKHLMECFIFNNGVLG